jgi:hypothetical protein
VDGIQFYVPSAFRKSEKWTPAEQRGTGNRVLVCIESGLKQSRSPKALDLSRFEGAVLYSNALFTVWSS